MEGKGELCMRLCVWSKGGLEFWGTHRDAYKAFPCPPFGKSDHHFILLIPAYKQKLKQEIPVTRSMRKWSDGTDATLQDCFASTDWNMFRYSFNDIEEYTTSVIGLINKCINDVVPTVTIPTYPNQKPWITGNIELKASGILIRTPIRNPAMPSDETSNKQSVNTGFRLNPTTPALMLVGCGRA